MILQYDREADRYNGLHCGQGLRLKSKATGEWISARIEKNTEWYVIDEYENTYSCEWLARHEIEVDID